MKDFQTIEFINTVKNFMETIENKTKDADVKFSFCQLAMNSGFDCHCVITYLYETLKKSSPACDATFLNLKWKTVIKHYITTAEANNDLELADKLRNIIDNVSSKGKEREEELKTKFFNVISGIGLDPILVEMDMTLDLWGWMQTLDLVLSMADKERSGEEAVVIEKMSDSSGIDSSVKELVHVEEISPATDEKSAETVVDKKVKKTRKRVKRLGIQQYSLKGELIGSFKNIAEAAKSGNYRHPSICKCLKGEYKSAYGFKWVGITQQLENTEESELAA